MAKAITIRKMQATWMDDGVTAKVLFPTAAPLPGVVDDQAAEWAEKGVTFTPRVPSELPLGWWHGTLQVARRPQALAVAHQFVIGRLCSWFVLGCCHAEECDNHHSVVSAYTGVGSGPGRTAP